MTVGATIQGSSDMYNPMLELLTKGHFRMKEESESTADVLTKQLTFQMEVEEKKKDKTEEWHKSTKNMIKNFASEDRETPAKSIPKSYLDIIKCKSIGLALQSLQASMDQRGHGEVGWPELLGVSIHNGLLLYKSMDKPSGLTVLCLYVAQPLKVNMRLRRVDYHYKKMEEFTKMPLHIPPNFDKMLIVIRGFHGLVTILFGDNCILANQLMLGINTIKSNRSRL